MQSAYPNDGKAGAKGRTVVNHALSTMTVGARPERIAKLGIGCTVSVQPVSDWLALAPAGRVSQGTPSCVSPRAPVGCAKAGWFWGEALRQGPVFDPNEIAI